ncbi:hypothetical protein LOK49_LG13G02805 [Camellia lanceoleosa]|uniref:Uncharacterized protein n=1 Tax=Camellia lanceoleosa TaxID=1840588 RepID=A0ACC0FGH9_9ERIC|nr:hypothetical protein LOK49_LG13G02805 [Camellia lanceoleosa]
MPMMLLSGQLVSILDYINWRGLIGPSGILLHPMVENLNIGRRYGVIECDPLVRKRLERTLGATAINLVAGEKPTDVYSEIAARVLDIMRKDAQKDPEVFPDALRARLLISQVDIVCTSICSSVSVARFL